MPSYCKWWTHKSTDICILLQYYDTIDVNYQYKTFTAHKWITTVLEFHMPVIWNCFYRYIPLTERSCANILLYGPKWRINATAIWSLEGSKQRRWKWKILEKETGHELPFSIPRNRRSSVYNNLLRKTSQSLLTAFSDLSLCS